MQISKRLTAAAVVGLAMLPAGVTWGHDGHHAPAAAPDAPAAPRSAVKLADTVLTDQDGRQLRLLSDVVADKVVVVNFVFTNCADACPMVSHTFSELQENLGAAMESRVRLVSLTVDPARDTSDKLKEYSARLGAKPGWLWLTGSSPNVTEALKGFGVYSANFENHAGVVLIGDGRSGKWKRAYDLDNAQRLMAKTQEVLTAQAQDRLASAGKE